MAIKIGKEYRITSDKWCVALEKRRINEKNKEEYWVSEGYYSNYKHALKALVKNEIAGLDDVRKIVRRIDEIEDLIDDLEFPTRSD